MAISHKDFDYTQLSSIERILLAQELWDSVRDTNGAPQTTPDQRAEIERRIALVDSGQMPSTPWPEMKARWQQKK